MIGALPLFRGWTGCAKNKRDASGLRLRLGAVAVAASCDRSRSVPGLTAPKISKSKRFCSVCQQCSTKQCYLCAEMERSGEAVESDKTVVYAWSGFPRKQNMP